MIRRLAVLGLAPLLLAGCTRSRLPVEEAQEDVKAALEKAATPEEKVQIVRDFLASYPESEHTTDMLETAVYYLVERLDAPDEADEVVSDVLREVKDPALRRDVLKARLVPLARLGKGEALAATVREIAQIAPLRFADRAEAVDAALEAGGWGLALELSGAALDQATAAAYRADYPERQFTEAEVADAARQRRAAMLAARGWAQANLGQGAAALAAFDEAGTIETRAFAGDSPNRLGSYRGRILLRLGRVEEALAQLAPDALFGNDEDALAAMREAFTTLHGSAAGFDEYLWSTRLSLARPIAEFTLPDYDGKPHRFSELHNGEVTLLAFWFPT